MDILIKTVGKSMDQGVNKDKTKYSIMSRRTIVDSDLIVGNHSGTQLCTRIWGLT